MLGKRQTVLIATESPRPLGRTVWTEEGEGSAAVLSLIWSKIRQQRRSKFTKLQDECSRSVGLSCLRFKSCSVSSAVQ